MVDLRIDKKKEYRLAEEREPGEGAKREGRDKLEKEECFDRCLFV